MMSKSSSIAVASHTLRQYEIEHIVVAAVSRTPEEIRSALEVLDAPEHHLRWRTKDSVPLIAEYYEIHKRMHSEAAVQRAKKMIEIEAKVGLSELYRMLPVDGTDRDALIYALSKINIDGHESFMQERKPFDLDKIRVR